LVFRGQLTCLFERKFLSTFEILNIDYKCFGPNLIPFFPPGNRLGEILKTLAYELTEKKSAEMLRYVKFS